jgi:hypothetical protein
MTAMAIPTRSLGGAEAGSSRPFARPNRWRATVRAVAATCRDEERDIENQASALHDERPGSAVVPKGR